ncbi:hypothetical protein Hdeb2414_s0022g00613291 [Helianthus debilis subsp. tardiflorus]
MERTGEIDQEDDCFSCMGLSIVMTLFETRKWIFSNEQGSRQRKRHRWETCLCRSHRCIPLAGFRENGFVAGASGTESRVKEGGKARESL